MVAAAGVLGSLRPALAWTLLLAAIGCLATVAVIADRFSNLRRIGYPKPPEILAEEATTSSKPVSRLLRVSISGYQRSGPQAL